MKTVPIDTMYVLLSSTSKVVNNGMYNNVQNEDNNVIITMIPLRPCIVPDRIARYRPYIYDAMAVTIDSNNKRDGYIYVKVCRIV